MNNINWKYYFKLTPDRDQRESNLLYTPTMNDHGNLLCMHYCIDKEYRDNTPKKLTNELIEFMFRREVRFLNELSHLKQTPKVYEIDYTNRKIFIEWNKETLSQILYDPTRSIDDEIPNWKDQLYDLVKDFSNAGYYKLSLYPHCFFVTKDKQIKTIDYYAVIPHRERYIEREMIEGVIGENGVYRFDVSTTSTGHLDFKKFFEITANDYLISYWNDTVFSDIFKRIYLND